MGLKPRVVVFRMEIRIAEMALSDRVVESSGKMPADQRALSGWAGYENFPVRIDERVRKL